MLSRIKNQIMHMHFDSVHGNYMISAQVYFPKKKFDQDWAFVIICHNKLSIRKFQSVHA